jgi:hypothetical protein
MVDNRITTNNLFLKAKQFVVASKAEKSLDNLIKECIIEADRELRTVDPHSPLAWDIQPYNLLRTNIHAEITAITAADPGVITAASVDSDVTGHGFDNHATIRDIVLIAGVDGAEGSGNIEILNDQLFLLQYLTATTFSLKTLDGLNDVDTSGYTAYSDGGYVYHAGYVLNDTTILTGQSEWGLKRLCNPVTFDKYPAHPISENEVRQNSMWLDASYAQRPKRYRYWRNMASPTSETHYLFWYPVANQYYNLFFSYEKEIPDISVWTGSVYPFHPGEVHAYLWHGGLAHLAGMSKRVQRMSQERIVTKVEVMFAEKWIMQWERDKIKVRNFSRKMLGASGGQSDFYA